jgi:CMP/dCMP kinase
VIIAVDGPSAAGKGTIARAVAEALGYHFLDTGRLYRMVGVAMLRSGSDLSDEAKAANFAATLAPADYTEASLRTLEAAQAASRVAVYPAVRDRLLAFQRSFAAKKPGAVLDGRDIGTVVCPDAQVKLYVTASAEVRAKRRFAELRATEPGLTLAAVLADVRARDARDATRDVAPLLPAADAVILDTSALSRDDAVAQALAIVRSRT